MCLYVCISISWATVRHTSVASCLKKTVVKRRLLICCHLHKNKNFSVHIEINRYSSPTCVFVFKGWWFVLAVCVCVFFFFSFFDYLCIFIILYFLSDTKFLLRFLRNAKFAQLAARKRLVSYWTSRTNNREWFGQVDTQDKTMEECLRMG